MFKAGKRLIDLHSKIHVGPIINQSKPQRSLWGWLNAIFNKYDQSRVDAVGPDRACAEWLIRCGAGVKWAEDSEWFRDYNALPSIDKAIRLTIYEIDGTDSSVMHLGFRYFQGLRNCRKIIFHKSHYLDDEAMKQLSCLDHCLRDLQVSSSGNVSDTGVMYLSQLNKLEKLLLYDLPEVRNRKRCLEFLSRTLPLCKINFPYAQASEAQSTTSKDGQGETK